MKKLTTRLTLKVLMAQAAAKEKAMSLKAKLIEDTTGSGHVDTAIGIIISVVIGALLLALLTTLFKDKISPSVDSKVDSMFAA